MFLHARNGLRYLNRLHELRHIGVIELLADQLRDQFKLRRRSIVFIDIAAVRLVATQDVNAFVNLVAQVRIDLDEVAAVIERHIQLTARDSAFLLQLFVKLAFHQIDVHFLVWRSQLVITHPITEVTHVEAFSVIAFIVGRGAVAFCRPAKVKQEAFCIFQAEVVGERRSRQEHDLGADWWVFPHGITDTTHALANPGVLFGVFVVELFAKGLT